MPGYKDSLGPPSWVHCTGGEGNQRALHLHPTEQELQETEQVELHLLGLGMAAIAEIYDEDDCLGLAAAQLTTRPNQGHQPALLTWARLEKAALNCKTYQALHSLVSTGAPDDKTAWPDYLLPYHQHRHALLTVGCIVYLRDRPVIPLALRAEIMDHLHAGHSAVTAMYARATSCMYWPRMRDDIVRVRASCSLCNTIAPSNPSPPPHPVVQPAYPFSDICADFFEYSSKSYLVIVDRYSNWISIFHLSSDTSSNIIKALREYCICWGVPQSISTDGAANFTSNEIEEWLRRWGIHHRVSSYYYPRSNKRAEVGVKSAKRMIMNNLGPNGTLHSDKMARALLLHRNCPDPLTGLSPAQVIFGRVLRDHLPLQPGHFSVRAEWRQTAEMRERALAQRHMTKKEALTRGSKDLPPLSLGDIVMVQDQATHKAGRWTKTGKIVEVLDFDSYLIKIDGSNTVTKRNRKFLRKITTFIDKVSGPSPNEETSIEDSPSVTYPVPRSSSSPNTLPAPSLPVKSQPEVYEKALPEVPPEVNHTVSPEIPAQHNPPEVPRRKKLKEKWIVAKPKPQTPVHHHVPPPPGTKHDYMAMDEEAQHLREIAKKSLSK